MQTVAYHATFFQSNVATTGVAMRTADRRVFFVDDATGQWRELYDADAPHLHLHGRVDVAVTAAIADGDLVLKCSKTLQRAA
jgi:hypothetical protein